MTIDAHPDYLDAPEFRVGGVKVAPVLGRVKWHTTEGTAYVVPSTPIQNAWPSTSGVTVATLTYTPKKVGSVLRIRGKGRAGATLQGWHMLGVFRGTELLIADAGYSITVGDMPLMVFQSDDIPVTTLDPIVFDIKLACSVATTMYLNGSNAAPHVLGSKPASWVTIEEVG